MNATVSTIVVVLVDAGGDPVSVAFPPTGMVYRDQVTSVLQCATPIGQSDVFVDRLRQAMVLEVQRCPDTWIQWPWSEATEMLRCIELGKYTPMIEIWGSNECLAIESLGLASQPVGLHTHKQLPSVKFVVLRNGEYYMPKRECNPRRVSLDRAVSSMPGAHALTGFVWRDGIYSCIVTGVRAPLSYIRITADDILRYVREAKGRPLASVCGVPCTIEPVAWELLWIHYARAS